MDNALCGGVDSGSGITNPAVPISASAVNAIKAAILMGSPRYRAGFPYNVGTCTAQGVSLLPLSSCRNTADLATVRRSSRRLHLPVRQQDPELLRLA
jgi:acetylxylan esterase